MWSISVKRKGGKNEEINNDVNKGFNIIVLHCIVIVVITLTIQVQSILFSEKLFIPFVYILPFQQI